jgi:hypothetical protein
MHNRYKNNSIYRFFLVQMQLKARKEHSLENGFQNCLILDL